MRNDNLLLLKNIESIQCALKKLCFYIKIWIRLLKPLYKHACALLTKQVLSSSLDIIWFSLISLNRGMY